MAKYSGDPRWITTRYTSSCNGCETTIAKGQRAYYTPLGRKTYCEQCGTPRAAEFEGAAFDEDILGG